MNHIVRAVLIAALPGIVFLGGAQMITRLSGRDRVVERLGGLAEGDRKPLNQRLHYDRTAVDRHWGALDAGAFAAEARFLEMDLVFPLLYGAAFLASLLIGWAALGRPFNPA